MKILLYGGTIELELSAKHVYTVCENGGPPRVVPSVTQILGCIDKPALVQWAANMTVEYIRERIRPGVSYDEIHLSETLEEARFKFRGMSRQAKAIGTLVHEWIENCVAWDAEPLANLPVNEKAANSCKAAVAWVRENGADITHSETRIYSRKYGYAGTMDCFVGSVAGKRSIVDWKASAGVYDEYRFQTAAYAQAWAEMNGTRAPDRWLVRLDKETGQPEPVLFSKKEQKADLAAFLGAMKLHARLGELKNNGNGKR